MKNGCDFKAIQIFAVLMLGFLLSINAQEKGKFDIGADLMSRYVWRGSDFANSPSIQPYANYSTGGFKAEVWSAFLPLITTRRLTCSSRIRLRKHSPSCSQIIFS